MGTMPLYAAICATSLCHIPYVNLSLNFNLSCQFALIFYQIRWLLYKKLTGECELSQRYVTILAVIDETDADAFSLHLHS